MEQAAGAVWESLRPGAPLLLRKSSSGVASGKAPRQRFSGSLKVRASALAGAVFFSRVCEGRAIARLPRE